MKYWLIWICCFPLTLFAQAEFENIASWYKAWDVLEKEMDGQYSSATKLMDELLSMTDSLPNYILTTGVELYTRTNQMKKAFALLEKAIIKSEKNLCEKKWPKEVHPWLHQHSKWKEMQVLCEKRKNAYRPPTHPRLKAELEEMLKLDQMHRSVQAEMPKDTSLWELDQKVVDKMNLKRLEEMIDSFGFPTRKMAGKKGAMAAFLIIQHASLETQEKYFPQIEALVKAGEMEASSFCLLADRIRIRKVKISKDAPRSEWPTQLYGTQARFNSATGRYEFYPIEKEAEVEQRRFEMGLMPLKWYAKKLNVMYPLK